MKKKNQNRIPESPNPLPCANHGQLEQVVQDDVQLGLSISTEDQPKYEVTNSE